ncbi:hypothetical protein QBC37DRAFT_161673 [Rhypophila decipiens]|uniref:Uncharacterized protein n=1 Tax=Rhypophila decipiens TaxID=261697 RepID=A0AAN6Y8A4_9PEZI|nr:hypothetical protein QBC37DRAFT_161673 [Rhypophila decipiens]
MAPRAKDAPDSPNDGSNNDKPQPSPAEAYLFFTLIQYMRSKPDIDWEQVAVANGFKNAETAKVRFGQIKRKLGMNDTATQGAPPAPRAPRGGGRGKKGAAVPSPVAASPMAAAQVGEEGGLIADVLGPSPSGVKKPRKRNARPKTEDFASGEGFATPTKAKKTFRKAAIKNEEDSDRDDQATLPPPHVVDEDGEGHMELDEETNFKHEPDDEADNTNVNTASEPMPAQVHPLYSSATLQPIPGTTGSFQPNYLPAHGGSNDYDFRPALQAPGPIRERAWDDDEDGAISQLRKEALASISAKDKAANRAVKRAPAHSQPAAADNTNFRQEVNLSSMMAGGLPGGGSSGSYGTRQAAQFPDDWGMRMPNTDYDTYHGNPIFGDGSGSHQAGGHDNDYDDIGSI